MGREVLADSHWLPQLPALYFRGCDLTAEWLFAKEHVRVRFLATAPILILDTPGASLRGRVSKTQLARGSTETACQLFMGSWQTSNALALQAS